MRLDVGAGRVAATGRRGSDAARTEQTFSGSAVADRSGPACGDRCRNTGGCIDSTAVALKRKGCWCEPAHDRCRAADAEPAAGPDPTAVLVKAPRVASANGKRARPWLLRILVPPHLRTQTPTDSATWQTDQCANWYYQLFWIAQFFGKTSYGLCGRVLPENKPARASPRDRTDRDRAALRTALNLLVLLGGIAVANRSV